MSDRIVLHYLDKSRASRIVWLLEELELEYEFVCHLRQSNHLAPEELKKIWPMGTAPVVQIFKNGASEPISLGESGHIVQYLIQHYDTKGKLKADNETDQELVDFYLHFAEGSLQPHLVSILVGNVAAQKAPWPANYAVKALFGKVNSEYYLKMIYRALAFLEERLAKKGGGYFVGNHLTGADIIFEFPVFENILDNPELSRLSGEPLQKKDYPYLFEWAELIRSNATRKQALVRENSEINKRKSNL